MAVIRIKSFIKYWLPVIIYAIIIFQISSVPGEDLPNLFRYQDVFFHIIEYAIFAFLLSRAVKYHYPHNFYRNRFFWVFFLCLIYAASDEFHQNFVPHRHPSFLDVSYDGIGILLGNIFYR